MLLNVPISPGELLDKLTILEIKAERITEPQKLDHVRRELELLRATWSASPLAARDVTGLLAGLRAANEALWEVEDRLRACEAERRFDAEFVELARTVYHTNDRRAAIKRQINLLLGSEIVEEKSYKPY